MTEVTLTGYLASVPCRNELAGAVSLRFSLVTLTDATPFCSARLHRYDWFHVKAFGDIARAAAGLTLGQRVRVRGWLRTERMFHDGYNVYLTSIEVITLQPLDPEPGIVPWSPPPVEELMIFDPYYQTL